MLRNGLDHQITVGESGEFGPVADPIQQRGTLVCGELAAGHSPIGGVFEVSTTTNEPDVIRLDGHHTQPGTGHDLRDTRPHGAQPDDSDGGELARHGRYLRCDRPDASRARYAPVTCGDSATFRPGSHVSLATGSSQKPLFESIG